MTTVDASNKVAFILPSISPNLSTGIADNVSIQRAVQSNTQGPQSNSSRTTDPISQSKSTDTDFEVVDLCSRERTRLEVLSAIVLSEQE